MKRLRSLLAIWLALVLLVAPFSAVLAGGTPGDSGDAGHPWDDEVTGVTGPDSPESDLVQDPRGSDAELAAVSVSALRPGGTKWVGDAVAYFWQRVLVARVLARLTVPEYWR